MVKMSLTLYNITAEQLRINELLEESGGELTPEIEEALVLNENNFAVKADGYIESIAKYRALAEAADVRLKEMQRIKKTAENIEKRLKERLSYAMQVMERDSIDIGPRKLLLRRTKAVEIYDAARIPAAFSIVELKHDKKRISEALKSGELVPGAELIINTSIQIR